MWSYKDLLRSFAKDLLNQFKLSDASVSLGVVDFAPLTLTLTHTLTLTLTIIITMTLTLTLTLTLKPILILRLTLHPKPQSSAVSPPTPPRSVA